MTATTCGWCTTHSNMTPVSVPQVLRKQRVTTADLHAVQAAFRCDHCKKLSIGSTVIRASDWPPADLASAWWSKQVRIAWTPQNVAGKDFPDVPPHISSTADEAFKCKSIEAHRAAILMARSVIEATCKDKGVIKGQLASKIDQLAEQGLLRPHTQEAAHELRFLGNDMAHGDFVSPVDAHDAEEVLTVMSEILDEVYQGPARILRMRKKRQEKE